MRLVKRLIELALVILVISLFMKNKDVELQLNYFGLSQPIKVAFWELVTFCVSLGIIIAAVGDFVTQFKWVRERRRMIKTDQEHTSEVTKLEGRIGELESENQRLSTELEQKSAQLTSLPAPQYRVGTEICSANFSSAYRGAVSPARRIAASDARRYQIGNRSPGHDQLTGITMGVVWRGRRSPPPSSPGAESPQAR